MIPDNPLETKSEMKERDFPDGSFRKNSEVLGAADCKPILTLTWEHYLDKLMNIWKMLH